MTTTIAFPDPGSPDEEQAPCRFHTEQAATFTWLTALLSKWTDVASPSHSEEADQPTTRSSVLITYPSTARHTDIVAALADQCQDRDLFPHHRDGSAPVPAALVSGSMYSQLRAARRRLAQSDEVQAFRMVPASKATLLASAVQTPQEMGQALRLLREEAGLTISQLANKVAPERIAGTCRSTIARVFAGGTLCATREALTVLVKACGVDGTDVEVWVAAWERAGSTRKRRGRRPAHTRTLPDTSPTDSEPTDHDPTDRALTDCAVAVVDAIDSADTGHVSADRTPVTTPGPRTDLVAVDRDEADLDDNNDDNEVIGTVQITRGHLRTAVVLSALAGLAATSSQAPGVRNAGAVVLGVAGGLALLDLLRASTAAGPTTVPRAVSAAA